MGTRRKSRSRYAPSGSNIGPGPADLVYGGDPAKWLALAHTLKARFYLNTAEIIELRDAGVSNKVIDFMINTPSMYPPPPPPRPRRYEYY